MLAYISDTLVECHWSKHTLNCGLSTHGVALVIASAVLLVGCIALAAVVVISSK